jgi:hypothetical protein
VRDEPLPLIDQDEPLFRVYLTRSELRRLAQSYGKSVQIIEAYLRQRDIRSPGEKRAKARLRRIKARAAELPA